ncbi:MAG TPA: DUF4230 domain-containing protein [Roseiflexaceae bacterium]|nr:DUF4230 domain-containing protein [Roseiflexaceae bacterium]
MARYDYDDQRRREPDEEDLDDFPRRAPDYPPPRADSLMQRRLRAARGEEVDEESYEDDYPPPPRYARPRPTYPPAYSTGGGCASAALYLVLGGVTIVLLVLLFGRQLLSAFVPNVPQQVRQLVATPTTTLRDHGGTITQIRGLSRLETQSFSVERVVEAKVERGNPLDLLLSDRLLLIASGEVIAGVDLAKLKDSDVTISADGKTITLRLPPSEIFSKSLNNDRTRVYDRQTGIFASENKDLETQARSSAEAEILQAACEGGVMRKSADEAKRSLEQFLRLMDFDVINVIATPGQCIAPGDSASAAPESTPIP